MKKKVPIIMVSVIIFLIVAYFIFTYTVRVITEREINRIMGEETGRITQGEINTVTQSEIDRITKDTTKQKTEEITRKMRGGSATTSQLKEVPCDKTPAVRQFNTKPYYAGQLIDAHLHMPFTFDVPKAMYAQADFDAPILEKEIAAGTIVCNLDKENVNAAFGFYIVPNLLKGSAIQQIIQVKEKHAERIVPFLMPAHVSGLDITSEDAEQILSSNAGLFNGIGEIAFYKGSFKGVSPDAPALRKIYEVADKNNLIVMIHPDQGQRPAIERILKDHTGATFLFHGSWEMGPYAAEIVGKYPNAYFTIDTDLTDITNEGQSASLYGSGSKERFIADFKRDYVDVQESALTRWKKAIEANPDKFLWGTDRAFLWHFDPEVGALIEESGRAFIGRLDPTVQEKFAYKNAERLLASS